MVLADEINRATPKAQSALLEAMEEHQVTVEGKTYPLPQPFFVIATQNPSHQIGTFPLPESQLDRFLMRIELGYPDHQAERQLLTGQSRHSLCESLPVQLPPEQLQGYSRRLPRFMYPAALLDYCQAIINFTRDSSEYHCGLSPRAGLALADCGQSLGVYGSARCGYSRKIFKPCWRLSRGIGYERATPNRKPSSHPS